jgi:hypothetical protein
MFEEAGFPPENIEVISEAHSIHHVGVAWKDK